MHHIYIIYVLIQLCILIGIDSLDLPKDIIIIKPDYVSLGVSLLLELAILRFVNGYVAETIEKIN